MIRTQNQQNVPSKAAFGSPLEQGETPIQRVSYTPGLGNLKAAKRGVLAQSSPGRKTLEGGSGGGSAGDNSKG
jgi:hypothetical protein